jgi:hypothetical protein
MLLEWVAPERMLVKAGGWGASAGKRGGRSLVRQGKARHGKVRCAVGEWKKKVAFQVDRLVVW